MTSPDEIIESVKEKFGDAVTGESTTGGQASISVPSDKWPVMAKWLHGDAGYSFLSDLCGVDWLGREPRFEVVFNLLNMDAGTRLRIRVEVADGDPPKLPTSTPLWPTADWMEREAFDMFGIVFEGHPDLRRILMPDEWEGHPLRKDYAVGKVPVEFKHLSPGF